MGEVYEAFDPVLGRKVALKRIRSDLSDRSHMRSRFLRERTILAGFSHASIIPIFEVGEESGMPYYTMPLVTGSNFKEHIRTHRHCRNLASISDLLRLFLDVCHGIAYVHQTGILHRDIKAENIMLSSSGQVVIIDWGLACPIQKGDKTSGAYADALLENSVTCLGKCPGTLNYIAPERLFQQATERSDIYSLGVLFYFILTGSLPFSRKRVREFKKKWKNEFWEDPRKIVSEFDIPDVLMRIVQKTLSKDVESRYHSVMDLIEDLHLFFEGITGSLLIQELSPKRKVDWELFKENLSLHEFDQRLPDKLVKGFLAKKSLKTTFRIEMDWDQTSNAYGFGIAFDLLEPEKGKCSFSSGCFLWLSFKSVMPSFLYHRGMILFEIPGADFSESNKGKLVIEVDDSHIHFSLGKGDRSSYPKIFPSMGSRFGFVCDSREIAMRSFRVYSNDLMLRQSCLKVPDSLLRSGAHDEALEEYRRIRGVLVGYDEAQEAHFKSGLVLLNRYMQSKFEYPEESGSLYQQIWDTFDSLRGNDFLLKHWIGKAFLYRLSGDPFEEANCLEFAYHLLKKPNDQFVFECLCLARAAQVLIEEEPIRARFLLMISRNFPERLLREDFQKSMMELRQKSLCLPFFDPFPWEAINRRELSFRQTVELSSILRDSVSISVLLEKYRFDSFLTADGIFCALYGLLILGEAEPTLQFIQGLDEEFLEQKFCSVSLKKVLALYTHFSSCNWDQFFGIFSNDPSLLHCPRFFFHFTSLLALSLMGHDRSSFRCHWTRSIWIQKNFYYYFLIYKPVFIQCPNLFIRVCDLLRRTNIDLPENGFFSLFSFLLTREKGASLSRVLPVHSAQDWKVKVVDRYIQFFENSQDQSTVLAQQLEYSGSSRTNRVSALFSLFSRKES
ncbi:Serine/threonine-protein kinase PknA [Candidatus Similichlamydia laticola]|uniref:Serine/threonine-protein kinase PknA n=2 Tax=Candidatus Similichlamydia laticola TaxID=2170265 RepID=A0A369KI05_9BACT|nr:Serine/threonine-protein kinase PknA [Candidatus Similichlamydia laticola]